MMIIINIVIIVVIIASAIIIILTLTLTLALVHVLVSNILLVSTLKYERRSLRQMFLCYLIVIFSRKSDSTIAYVR